MNVRNGKSMISILVALASMFHVSYSQEVEIPKKSNKIVLLNDKTAADNFTFLKQHLAERGIEIANQDKDYIN